MKKYFILMICAALAVCACTKADGPETVPADNAITLSVGVRQLVNVETKASTESVAPYAIYTETVPSTAMPLYAAIWASSVSHKYTGVQSYPTSQTGYEEYQENGYVDYHNTTKFTSGARQLLDYQLYYPSASAEGDIPGTSTPLAESPVYFIGLCPRSESGWSVVSVAPGTDNGAQHTFDGKEDVMFAPEVSKNITQTHLEPKLTFSHMLTWILIKVKAEDANAANTWGKIHNIKIFSPNTITIKTDDGTATFGYDDANNTTLHAFKVTEGPTYTKSPFSYGSEDGISLTSSYNEVAYVLCAPVTADGSTGTEYTLTMDIGSRLGVQVPVSLKNADNSTNFSGSTAGYQFTVSLTFRVGENISAYATVTPWENGGVAVTPVKED